MDCDITNAPEEKSLPPSIKVRWLRPTTSTPHLQLPTAPVVASNVDTWIALTEEESVLCEKAWAALSEEQRAAALNANGCANRVNSQGIDPEEPEGVDDLVGVSIHEDGLFEVDVRSMELRPIYWKLNAPRIKVRRATWMYDETKPVSQELCDQLDAAYQSIQPWQPSYQLEITSAAKIGVDAYEKLKYPITPASPAGCKQGTPRPSSPMFVIFEDAFTAKLISGGLNKRVLNPFYSFTSRSAKTNEIPFSGLTVYYGYDNALAARTPLKAASSESLAPMEKEKSAALVDVSGISADESLKDVKTDNKTPSAPAIVDNSPKQVTDLVLVIHGIGQGLTPQYESWSFLYAVNLFRQIAKKQSGLPVLASILRDKQVQFLPVEWRAPLKLGEQEERDRQREGLDNSFTITDITPKKSIPVIRELTNNVLIDIPYFMSHHQNAMIESVCVQANRIYRSWCARNPGFDKYGRVHLLSHSLGSILSAYVLSKQPTFQPSLSTFDPELIKSCRSQFLFNTSTMFNIGSPLPVFVHLNHAQIIARKGRVRTKDSASDEALDRQGVFGCFAVDSVYNIFHPSDPIAYLLNPCVDAQTAKNLPPSIIPNFTSSMISGISLHFTRIWEDVIPKSLISSPPKSRTGSPSRPVAGKSPSSFELLGHNQLLQGSRAERRFAALNPHGTLDFQLVSEGSISEYVDMITAHSSYWQDPNLAAFVLVELFANQEDLARTGLIPASHF